MRELGKHGLKVTELCLDCMHISWMYGGTDESKVIANNAIHVTSKRIGKLL